MPDGLMPPLAGRWFRLRYFQVVVDAWPNAKMRRLVGGKRWVLALITQDERADDG